MIKVFCDKCGKTMELGQEIKLRPSMPDAVRPVLNYIETDPPVHELCENCYGLYLDWIQGKASNAFSFDKDGEDNV